MTESNNMLNIVNQGPLPAHRWHEIATGFGTTLAMNVPSGVVIERARVESCSVSVAVATSLVFVPGLYVCKRWQVEHIEAGKDEETGVSFEARDVWSVEVALVSDCASSSQGVDEAIAEHRLEGRGSPYEIGKRVGAMLVRWVNADGPLPSLKAAGIDV